jgi:hypothetical protein
MVLDHFNCNNTPSLNAVIPLKAKNIEMAKSNTARASKGASGISRNRRHRVAGPAWIRPLWRAHRALDASLGLIDATLRTIARSERCAHRRPIGTSRNLDQASAQLIDATSRLSRAVKDLALSNECLRREPHDQTAVLAPEFLLHAAERWLEVTTRLQETADDVFSLHEDVLHGLATGSLIPERPAKRHRSISLTPPPMPIRAFLLLRQPRVVDRISPILRRRRRTRHPASVEVPRRNLLGRAPPRF